MNSWICLNSRAPEFDWALNNWICLNSESLNLIEHWVTEFVWTLNPWIWLNIEIVDFIINDTKTNYQPNICVYCYLIAQILISSLVLRSDIGWNKDRKGAQLVPMKNQLSWKTQPPNRTNMLLIKRSNVLKMYVSEYFLLQYEFSQCVADIWFWLFY